MFDTGQIEGRNARIRRWLRVLSEQTHVMSTTLGPPIP
jgi:hypothetical protein